jgi:type III pantothenate kinase
MFLAIDIGNTDAVFGFYQNNWQYIYRISSSFSKNFADYEAKLRLFFLEKNLHIADISAVAISSVVPNQTPVFQELSIHFLQKEALVLGPEIYAGLPIKVLRPNQIGADLVCNAMYAFSKQQAYATVLDFGTALTATTVNIAGDILGVSIAPGLKTAIKALFSNTAQLPEVPLHVPQSVLGQDTVHAIQAGVMYLYVGGVQAICNKLASELGQMPYLIATGGLSGQLQQYLPMVQEFNYNATLEGLRLVWQHRQAAKTQL